MTFQASASSSPGFCDCYSEAIVPQGTAFDAVYRTGSLMMHKLHFQAPVTSLEVNCGSLLKLTGFLNVAGTLTSLPAFMSIDEPNRALKVSIPAADEAPYLNQKYLIEVHATLDLNSNPYKSF